MNTSLLDLLDSIAHRQAELSDQMGDPAITKNPEKLRTLGREHRRLAPITEAGERYRTLCVRIAEAEEIIADGSDAELVELARDDIGTLIAERDELEDDIRELLVPPDPNDNKAAIVEIRAGTGGEEAALFAADLMRMYLRYADQKGWAVEMLGSSETGVGGFKEVIFSVEGENAYGTLKYESGVHRVQRVPVTEASGRIHTSAASVAVLPEVDQVEIAINPYDLKVDVFRSSGPGGQSVNTTDSAVRITHLPTNTVVTCQDEKSQLKNKNKAMKVLRARLYAAAEAERTAKLAAERRLMVSTGDRSAKIRTYNFPQNRVTDHRIGLTLQALDRIIDGELGPLVEALRQHDRRERASAPLSGSVAL
jgi:peptide chain release factor 1